MFYVTDERKWVQFTVDKNTFKKGLTPTEAIILKAIETLDRGQGCFATNAYFAEYFNLHPVTVSKNINSLKDKGFSTVVLKRQNTNKTKRIIKTIKMSHYTEQSQVIGVINYINGMFKEEHDFEPIKPTTEIKKAIQQKIKEYHSQKELIQYLKIHRDNFLSTHGVSLWLTGQLTKEQLNM